jgi:hypothetical protein
MQRLSATMLRLARIGWDFRQPELQVGNLEVVQETVERYEPLAEKEGMALLLEGGREISISSQEGSGTTVRIELRETQITIRFFREDLRSDNSFS